MIARIELDQVQRIILFGVSARCVRHYLLSVTDVPRARAFLSALVPQLSYSDRQAQGPRLSLALTYSGLRTLQVPHQYIGVFRELAPEFVQGAAARAALKLGDTGASEAPRWELPYRSADTHVLLTLHAGTARLLETRAAELLDGGQAATGLSGWDAPVDGERLGAEDAPREHFGFRDGVSQPVINGLHDEDREARNPPSMRGAAGEFLLGYVNDDGANRWAAADVLSSAQEFVRNGSFVALRKMRQDVRSFGRLPLEVQAKMCGRWPDGAVLRPGVAQPASASGRDINQFDFGDDPHGQGCPFTSHIRRLNPRADAVIPPRKRLLIRRGTPYGKPGDDDVGLLGLFICASLPRQFEFLLKDWCARAPMLPGRDIPDALLGPRPEPRPVFEYPAGDTVARVELGDYVTTRGTLYGFYPSRRALAIIGALA